MTVLDLAPGIADPGRMDDAARPDPKVPERARRWTFTAKYKLEVLAAYDAAPDGEKAAILRREGLADSPYRHGLAWGDPAGTSGAQQEAHMPDDADRSRDLERIAAERRSRRAARSHGGAPNPLGAHRVPSIPWNTSPVRHRSLHDGQVRHSGQGRDQAISSNDTLRRVRRQWVQ
jgi:hypothetical protein